MNYIVIDTPGLYAQHRGEVPKQLCVDVQIPAAFGGHGGGALYIDTEGSFYPRRVAQMAEAAVAHCRHIAETDDAPGQREAMQGFTVEAIMSRIHYKRCSDHDELTAAVRVLPAFLRTHPTVKLIVIDSIAYHFRYDFDDFALRNQLLGRIAQTLLRLATERDLAVVLTNQMTTKFSDDGQSFSVPALGDAWSHASTVRVILSSAGTVRRAALYKHPARGEGTACYQILTEGIRDVVDSPPSPPGHAGDRPGSGGQGRLRSRGQGRPESEGQGRSWSGGQARPESESQGRPGKRPRLDDC
ncbi:PREDICTED: DNA repair protein RAD51 homolog 3-like [Priapulus caudatus]|uniref:DNA repair protein RAD51 homolog 3 n=1 Tax=Priapulus caudatus TaxID=37621 RepID=A0ABM1EW18_PRICU|nr:PREDICTED: DNA repair protein RAD51 homolog 3-like [Priapulus caudatus]